MSVPHQKLVAWQRADDFFITVHRVTHRYFPREEKYELGSQIRKSAYSVPANIVEGNARDADRDKLRFFNFASSSLNETGYGLHAAHRLGYLSDQVYDELEKQLSGVGAPLHGLIRAKRATLTAKLASTTAAITAFAWQLAQWLL
jgi:four helix bundle protein